jgi:hydroxysqualene dehydroxylase
MASGPHVVVVGGGVAGISAAVHLLDRGCPVTLVESRGFLGGRAFSFTDAETGQELDNGQHVIVGCCGYFRDLLQRLGAAEEWYLQPRLRLRVLDRHGNEGLLAGSSLPSPLHLLPSFLSYPHLGPGEKLRAVLALGRARFTRRHQPRLESISFYQWLKEQGQSERAIQNLWNLLVMPTLNDDVREVSASMGLMIVQDGMLGGRHSADVGYPRRGLLPALGGPARDYLLARGCRLLLRSPVKGLCFDAGKVAGVKLASGESLSADAYVSALPFDSLLRALPPAVVGGEPFFGRLKGLETSPIINVHLWYDRPVMEGDFCAFVDSPVQWVFNQSAILAGRAGVDPASEVATRSGQRVCISVSAAWEYIGQTREELAETFISEMARVFPRAGEARVLRAVVVKQRHATFRCRPGANDIRPGSVTPLSNLFLAGEWTRTGWPSTMESAARSGYNAAGAVGAQFSS